MMQFDMNSNLGDLVQPKELYPWLVDPKDNLLSLKMIYTDMHLMKKDGDVSLVNYPILGKMEVTHLGNYPNDDLEAIVTNLWDYIEINKAEIIHHVQKTNEDLARFDKLNR